MIDPVQRTDGSTSSSAVSPVELEQLRQADERVRGLFHRSPLPCILVLLSGWRILDVNEQFVEQSGFSRDEAIGQTAEELGLWVNAKERDAWVERIKEKGVAHSLEICLRDRQGRARPHLVSGQVLPWPEGPVLLVTGTEITRQKELEHALRQSQAQYRRIVETAEEGVWVNDPAWRTTFVNRRMAEMLGYRPEEMIGQPIHAFVYKEDIADLQQKERERRPGQNGGYERRLRRKDGSEMWTQAAVTAVREDDGSYGGSFGMFTDITERKRTDEALRASEERLRQMAENIECVFWMSNAQLDKMLYVSCAYERIWGRSLDSLYENPRSFLEAVHPEDREGVEAGVRQRESTRLKRFEVEYRIVRPDGSIRWIRDRGFPIQSKDERLWRMVGIAEDITEKKCLEAKFLRAQRLESIGTLASGVAHDLNNVLAPILMAVDLLAPKLSQPDDKQLIGMLASEAKRGAGIVKQLLAFARGMDGERTELQSRILLKEVAKVIRETFPKSISLRQQIPEDLWTIRADASQIHQVLLNLCVNARDAMPGGGVLVLAGENIVLDEQYALLNTDARPGPYTVLQVVDTGMGISPELMNRIFDPFFTTKKPGEGTGLGLSTSVAIVKSHGGFLQVQSRVGQGAQFRVYLPALRLVLPESETAPESLPQGHGDRVLVVDDEEVVRRVAQRFLQANGYRVLTAADGAEALIVFRQSLEPIGLVLTDLVMPTMDGTALIRALRSIAPGLPILAMSGLHVQPADDASAQIRADALLHKPFTPRQILEAVQQVLSQRGAAVKSLPS